MASFPLHRQERPWVAGHRGAAAHAPENTVASFEMGVELGADAIEFDIHESRDGHLIVMHDPEVARTTDGHGRIKDMTLEELKRLDAGAWFGDRFRVERVPTLSEVLDWAHGRTPVIIEIKGDSQPAIGIERKLVKALRDHSMVGDAILIDYPGRLRGYLNQAAPDGPQEEGQWQP